MSLSESSAVCPDVGTIVSACEAVPSVEEKRHFDFEGRKMSDLENIRPYFLSIEIDNYYRKQFDIISRPNLERSI